MIKTANGIINSIKNGSEQTFIDLIGVDLKTIGKNKDIIHSDFTRLCNTSEKFPNIQRNFIDIPNELGQKVIQVLFYTTNSTDKKDVQMRLDLYFGPPSINSMDRLSGYKIINPNF